ncbi:MAG TPA: hypothetical protein ENI20_13220 [Bacteroides sp.]|nr:hypothetical protein [Bacteroides sp.]
MIRKTLLLILSLALLAGCQSKKGKWSGTDLDVPDSLELAADIQISEEALEEIVQNVSSPIEMAALIKEIGTPFSIDYLATTDYVDKYNTSFQMAYILGVFGADLGYLNIYDKNTQMVDHLSSINRLADGIKVGQFFDFNTLKRLATSRENIDSLMYMSVSTFNNMDSYLRSNQRGHLSAVMITGIWVEGMYLATQVAMENDDPALSDRIGEQKLNMNNLFLILNAYESQTQVQELIEVLSKIKVEFDQVQITYKMGDPETVEQDGMIMIVQNEKSIVHITDEQMKSIIRITEEVRNQLIEI